ncbi:MAG: hypothetical protein MJZ91_08750 [Bacteroidales bacterium]|nr:hypothetical protein [Bacteroidales bacterium]
MKKICILTFIILLFLASCKQEPKESSVGLIIHYSVDGKELVTDSLCYQNEAGNQFLITEIQWFISNIEIKNAEGKWLPINQDSHIFYLDENDNLAKTFASQFIPVGQYVALRFTFGLDENDNQNGLFVNPPESDMFWPEPLGGGYHYMKLNGKWLDENGCLSPINVHLGIGQNEDLTEFYQNYFQVEIPFEETFHVTGKEHNTLQINMDIANWFRNPHTYDFNVWGGAIMQNQAAQQVLKENGQDVFSVEIISCLYE